MTNRQEFERQAIYQIRLRGLLDPEWSDWFDGLTITHQENTTLLNGMVIDQSALHGLLAKICELGLPLISLQRLDAEGETFEKQDDAGKTT